MTTNSLRTVFLMSLVIALFMALGNLIGGQSGMILALIISLALNFFSYWYSDKMVLRMYNAQEVDRNTAPELYTMVEELAAEANTPMPRVYIIPQMQPNAFATGRNPSNAAVAATEGILRMLNKEELRGVMAHEIAHIVNRDILTQTIVITFVSAISYLANFALFFGGSNDEDSPNPILLIATMLLAPIAGTLLQAAISRSREYEADRLGAELCGKPSSLANALHKIEHAVHQIPMQMSTAGAQSTSHMFPVNPFSGSRMLRIFSTHPPTEERISNLMEMERSGIYPQ
jgi:heat shock protein HtpX